jgi:hypothetical protein
MTRKINITKLKITKYNYKGFIAMKTVNPKKFIAAAIEVFKRKVIELNKPADFHTANFDPLKFYSNGHCAEFAFSLAKLAADNDIDANITIMYSDSKSPDTNKLIERTFSHCVVEFDGESFDINGNDARCSWFLKHDYMYQDEVNVKREWQFVTIPFEDHVSAYEELRKNCNDQEVPLSLKQIFKDIEIFQSVFENKIDTQELSV